VKVAMTELSSTMSERFEAVIRPDRPGWIGAVAVYVFFAAVVVRTLSWSETDISRLLPWYMGLEFAFLILFTITLWRPPIRPKWLHFYFGVQAAIIFGLLSIYSHLDFLTILFALLCYQVALVFKTRDRWIWIGIFIVLTCGSLMIYKGALKGLSLAMTPMAGCLIFSAFTIASQETELARKKSQALLRELQDKHQQLQEYTGQVEELTAMEERNRLARELHNSVSQTMFSILLNTRSAQIMLKQNPSRLRFQLEQLQTQTMDALTQMRSLINQLRPVDPKRE
jgi:signal transduction histidine kinase